MPSTPPKTAELAELLRSLTAADGLTQTPVPSVHYMRCSQYISPRPLVYEPGLCFLASGQKHVRLGGETFTYNPFNFLVLSVPLPIECEVFASLDQPVLGLRIDVSPISLSELLLELSPPSSPTASPPPTSPLPAPPRGIYDSPLTDELRDALLRLARTFLSPTDARVLGPSIVREILYRVLLTEQHGALRALAARHTRFTQISKALHLIHTSYAKPISVDDLADAAAMSPSAFHENFRAVTDSSPLQYLKSIRLHKARALMLQDGLGAAQAALEVGYESPSQFSREFKRLFGTTPSQEAALTRSFLAANLAAGIPTSLTSV